MIDLQPQQMEVDARYNGTEMTQITKASEVDFSSCSCRFWNVADSIR